MCKKISIISVSLILGLSMLMMAQASDSDKVERIVGDYIEVRSDNVHMEPCFFSDNTRGKEATLIWHVQSGSYSGISLDALTAVAVVMAKSNLADDVSTRKSALYIDSTATLAQLKATERLFKEERGYLLGEVVSVKVLPIEFRKGKSSYGVRVGSALKLEVPTLFSLNSHPYLHRDLWYDSFEAIGAVQVGESVKCVYKDKENPLSARWIQIDQSVYAGNFSIYVKPEKPQKYVRK